MMKEEITKIFEELSIFFKNWRKIIINQKTIYLNFILNIFLNINQKKVHHLKN